LFLVPIVAVLVLPFLFDGGVVLLCLPGH
jgi:high-affinity nickel permease